MSTLARLILAFALTFTASVTARAQDATTPASEPVAAEPGSGWLTGGTFSVQIENDKIANTDRHYTNGFRMGWVSDRNSAGPEWLRDSLDFLYPFAALKGSRIGFTFGQTMFTPNDTNTRTLIRDDRPYAGWLFVGASLHGEALDQPGVLGSDPIDVLDTVELTLGIVGPHAYGKEVQNAYHDLINVDESNGWDNQLKDEPTVNLMLERRWRPSPLSFLGVEADAIPSVGASLGNVFTYGGGGMILRLGQRLDIDYGPSHIQPSLSGPEVMNKHTGFSWYLFAGTEGRAVARNLFLDGNTFRDSPSVDSKPFVADFQVGVAMALGSARLSLAEVWRTKEFDEQKEPDKFGTLNLSWHF